MQGAISKFQVGSFGIIWMGRGENTEEEGKKAGVRPQYILSE